MGLSATGAALVLWGQRGRGGCLGVRAGAAGWGGAGGKVCVGRGSGAPGARVALRSQAVAVAPMSSMGWRMVVRAGVQKAARGASSKPMTEPAGGAGRGGG